MKKSIDHINNEAKCGKSVVATVAATQPNELATPPEKVDIVTSATLKNNIYMPPMPVMVPPPLQKKK